MGDSKSGDRLRFRHSAWDNPPLLDLRKTSGSYCLVIEKLAVTSCPNEVHRGLQTRVAFDFHRLVNVNSFRFFSYTFNSWVRAIRIGNIYEKGDGN